MERKQYIHSSKINSVRQTVLSVSVVSTVRAAVAAFAIFAVTSLTSCVKDDLYNTPHPDKGKVAVTADWSNRGEGMDIPGLWRAVIGDYTAEETRHTHEAERLFEPGDYRLITYNPADGITVAGTTATISAASTVSAAASGERGNAFISGSPGWFFANVQEITIEKDREHAFTTAMRQQVRQLTLLIEPAGNTAAAIENIAGSLSGVAGTFDFATDTYGGISDVELDFKKLTEGADAGKWKATVRLLGIAGNVQRLSATATYAGGNLPPATIESDLAAALAGFNTNKTVPLTLGGTMVETPVAGGMTAIITDWEAVDAGNVDAH